MLFKKGFTLLELIISVGVIILIVSIFFFNFKTGRRTMLKTTAYKLVSDVEKVQKMSRGEEFFDVNKDSDCLGGVCSFGVYFGEKMSYNNKYIIFVDKNLNNKYDDTDKVLKTVFFPTKIWLFPMDADSIVFRSPFGEGVIADEKDGNATLFLIYQDDIYYRCLFNINITGGHSIECYGNPASLF